jgi:hypothetical protein
MGGSRLQRVTLYRALRDGAAFASPPIRVTIVAARCALIGLRACGPQAVKAALRRKLGPCCRPDSWSVLRPAPLLRFRPVTANPRSLPQG